MSDSYPRVDDASTERPIPLRYQADEEFRPSSSLLNLGTALLNPRIERGDIAEPEEDAPLKEIPLGRRERERLMRRREILLTARRLFAANGYTGTTLDEVARLTEFSKPTLYQYFRNKDHLYFTILEEGLADMRGILDKESHAERSMGDNLRAIVLLLLIYFRKNTDFFLMLRQYRDQPRPGDAGDMQNATRDGWERFHQRLAALLGRGVRRGDFARYDLNQLASILFEAVGVYTLAFQKPDELRSAREMADELMNLFFYGILQR
ncbi:MAG: TetR/AcrR family transcriptional regulator [Calditrichaeota bacterium]|nr:TetR/AcrR family transcriptional regulator [Calditrichota bacterium]